MYISISGNDPHIDFLLESKVGRIAPEREESENLREESEGGI